MAPASRDGRPDRSKDKGKRRGPREDGNSSGDRDRKPYGDRGARAEHRGGRPAEDRGGRPTGDRRGAPSRDRGGRPSEERGGPRHAERGDRRGEGTGRPSGERGRPSGDRGRPADERDRSAGAAAGGRPAGGKPSGKPTGGKPTKGAATERFRKAHRKGPGPEGKPKSAPDVKSGQVRLNNAKPARDQNPLDVGGDGATYVKGGTRLQKVLAQSGVASRRGAEELIAAGRVEVDGEVVTEQGLRIDPETAVVRVDGARVVVNEEHQYLALNKPKGWQSTMADEFGRPCIGDLVAERVMAGQRLFHVGRLDADTEGLILLTNDGELAHRLMHPSFEVPKTYMATVRGEVNRSLGRTLRDGIELDDGPAKVDKFALLDVNEGISLLRLTLHEGRKRIVRRMLDETGHPVIRLVRTDIGAVNVGEQRPGTLRVMGNDEIGALYKAVGM
ncbi:MFS transporter [Williamsia sp. 1138]|uniref:Pseudouridine synthase n=1 Tax=Gordonia rubripertincta TaxID=36822 RepID=A0ABT4MWD4_GORRU|nr:MULTISPECIES: pseudouridine synthase [Mycobacteriales]MCZ4550990.1 pseudouridine synthase [Gordonia rubripertincta]OZG27332.1 MFS transporter [Williamsia sp. 1138]